MSTLLISEKPISVLPSLAAKIGLNEAIVLQQVHYWLVNNETNNHKAKVNHFVDDRWWAWNTMEEWQKQFPWMSVKTVKRTIGKLEVGGFLLSKRPWAKDYRQTKWYTIDYDRLAELEILIQRENQHKIATQNSLAENTSNPMKSDRVKLTRSSGSKKDVCSGQFDPISTETSLQKLHSERSIVNQYPELTQESECAIAEEFSHLKEDSLTKKKAGTRSRTIQQSKSTLDEAKTLEIKTPTPQPPSPPVDRPTKKSKNPLDALTEDKDGWLVAPTKGTYKLAGIITLRRMQYAIASTFLSESYEFEFNENGELEVIYKGDVLTWQEFEKDYAIGMLRNLALHDQAASGYLNAEWWNETIEEFFLESVEFCKRSKDALAVSRSQPASVLFGDIEPDEDDED